MYAIIQSINSEDIRISCWQHTRVRRLLEISFLRVCNSWSQRNISCRSLASNVTTLSSVLNRQTNSYKSTVINTWIGYYQYQEALDQLLCHSGDLDQLLCHSGDLDQLLCHSGDLDQLLCHSGDLDQLLCHSGDLVVIRAKHWFPLGKFAKTPTPKTQYLVDQPKLT